MCCIECVPLTAIVMYVVCVTCNVFALIAECTVVLFVSCAVIYCVFLMIYCNSIRTVLDGEDSK